MKEEVGHKEPASRDGPMSGDDAATAYAEVHTLLCHGSDTMSWDALWESINFLSGTRTARSRGLREEVMELSGCEEVGLQRYASILELMREKHGLGSREQVLAQLETFLLHEIFAARQNKEGKLLKTDLRKYLEQLHTRLDTPKPRIADFDRLVQAADLESNKHLTRDDFTWFISEIVRAERPDLTMTDFVQGSRTMGTLGTFEQLKEKTRLSLALSLFGKRAGSPLAPRESRERLDDDTRPPSSPATSSPRGSGALARGWGRMRDKLAPGSFSGSMNNPSLFRTPSEFGALGAESLHSQGACEECDRKDIKMRALRADLDDAMRKLAAAAASLGEAEAAASERERRMEVQEGRVATLTAEGTALSQEVVRLQAALADRAADGEKRAKKEVGEVVDRARRAEKEVKSLQAALRAEHEKNDEVARLRKHDHEVETKRKADFAKLRHEKDEQIADLRKMIETLEIEKRLAEAETRMKEEAMVSHHRRPSYMRRMGHHSSMCTTDSDITEEADANAILFLPAQNQDRLPASAEQRHATLFDGGPILYTFNVRIFPSDLCFDLHLSGPVTKEHITMRDYASERSVCLELSSYDLQVPCTTLSTRLNPDTWHTVAVQVSWGDMTYAVCLDGRVVFPKVPFRDATSEGLSVFDVYPRTSLAVSYANIRFTTGADRRM